MTVTHAYVDIQY